MMMMTMTMLVVVVVVVMVMAMDDAEFMNVEWLMTHDDGEWLEWFMEMMGKEDGWVMD